MPVLLAQGLELLVYGMGTVVVFLTLLVAATRLMSWLVLSYFPEPQPVAGEGRRTGIRSPTAPDPSPELLAAISAAVHLHRQRREAARESGKQTGH